jgi:hypothetical protein
MSSHSKRVGTTKPADDIAELLAQNTRLAELISMLVERVDVGNAASFTIRTFCKRNGLSESQYHKLRREGRGPRTMSTGDVGVRISREAEAEWIRERECEATADVARTTDNPRVQCENTATDKTVWERQWRRGDPIADFFPGIPP